MSTRPPPGEGDAPRGDRLKVVAHFPGRLRVRAETFRVLPEVAADVVRRVEAEPGVSEVTSSATTGSVLVLYDPRETQILRLLRTLIVASGLHGIEVDERALEEAVRPGQRVRRAAAGLDEQLRRAAAGQADLRSGVPATLAALGVGKLLFGRRRLPEWYDLLFWSFVTFVNLNPREDDAADARGADAR